MEKLDWSFLQDEIEEQQLLVTETPLWEGIDLWLEQEELPLWN